ncbi:FimB/Mfa2 family fimbrial subunit [Dysgonomonas sp.]
MNKNITISLAFHSMDFSVKAFGLFIIFVLMLFLSGCNNDKVADEDETFKTNVTMTLKSGAKPAFMDNALIYVFTNDDKFKEKKLNMLKNGNILSTYMPVGTWNIVLLTCDTDIADKITPPPYGGANTYPMWKTGYTTPANEFLSQTPAELRYESLPGTAIIENLETKKQATLNRNVAKIQVILKNYTGFDQINPGKNTYAFVDLLDVPTTLDWKGGYYPGKDNPDNSGNIPIREYFNFDNQLKADTVNFIVPAHRGSDAFDVQHNDTTTHKLRLRTSMPLKGQSYFGKTPVEISFVPKVNRIIQLIITFRGEPETNLDIKVTVKDWADPIDQEVVFD